MFDFIMAFLVCGIIFFAMPLIVSTTSLKSLNKRLEKEEKDGLLCALGTKREIKNMKLIRWIVPAIGLIGMGLSFLLL